MHNHPRRYFAAMYLSEYSVSMRGRFLVIDPSRDEGKLNICRIVPGQTIWDSNWSCDSSPEHQSISRQGLVGPSPKYTSNFDTAVILIECSKLYRALNFFIRIHRTPIQSLSDPLKASRKRSARASHETAARPTGKVRFEIRSYHLK